MTGIKLSSEDGERLKNSVETLKDRYKRQKVCKFCSEPIVFKHDPEKNRYVPYDLDEIPHWRTCPYDSMTQKRASFGILKKVAVHFCLENPTLNIEETLGLTEKEGKVMHAILEKVVKEIDERKIEESPKVEGDLTFKPEPTDPVGDPDEDIAPSEDLVSSSNPEDLAKPSED